MYSGGLHIGLFAWFVVFRAGVGSIMGLMGVAYEIDGGVMGFIGGCMGLIGWDIGLMVVEDGGLYYRKWRRNARKL